MDLLKKTVFILPYFLIAALALIFTNSVSAQTKFSYPVKELGNCKNAEDCRNFCDNEENLSTCDNFAKNYKLGRYNPNRKEPPPPPQIKFPIKELGNCGSFSECRTYCEDPSNIQACLDFAKKNRITPLPRPPEDDEDAPPPEIGEKMMKDLGCKTFQECSAFCNNPDNMPKCMAVADKYGWRPKRAPGGPGGPPPEVMKAMAKELGCKGPECEKVCNKPENQQKCLEIGKRYGWNPGGPGGPGGPPGVSPEVAQKMMKELGCQGEQCRIFCEQPANQRKCGEVARKYGVQAGPPGGGPPPEMMEKMEKELGCKGYECKEFCDKPENGQRCGEIAQKYGLGPGPGGPGGPPPEMMEKMEKELGCRGEECKAFCDRPENGPKCMEIGRKYGMGPGPGGPGPGGPGQMGPMIPPEVMKELGCNSPEECGQFCSKPENSMRCGELLRARGINPGGPGPGPGGFGPGSAGIPAEVAKELGCKPEECLQNFCNRAENSGRCGEVFRKFGWGPGGPGPGGGEGFRPPDQSRPECTDYNSCSAYCEKQPNKEECRRRFGLVQPGGPGGPGFGPGQFQGPNQGQNRPECTDYNSCTAYCEKQPNKEDCRRRFGLMQPGGPGQQPQGFQPGLYQGPNQPNQQTQPAPMIPQQPMRQPSGPQVYTPGAPTQPGSPAVTFPQQSIPQAPMMSPQPGGTGITTSPTPAP